MEEFLKYISPVAVLTSIWGIFQFYEKRKYERNEKRRNEKLEVIKNFHTILNNIKINLLDYELEIEIKLNLLKDKIFELDKIGKKFEEVTDFKELDKLSSKSKASSKSASELTKQSETELNRLSKSLKNNLFELNNVSLLNIVIESKLKEEISNLSDQIKSIIIQIETNKREAPFNDKVRETLKNIYLIEKSIVSELK